MPFAKHIQKTCKRICRLVGFFCVLSTVQTPDSTAQQSFFLSIKVEQAEIKNYYKTDTLAHIFRDTIEIHDALLAWQKSSFQKSYYEASIDKISRKDSIFEVSLHVGKPYEWLNLEKGNVEAALLDKVAFREKKFQNSQFKHDQLLELQNSIVRYLENNGYPFAAIGLDSVRVSNYTVSAKLQIKKGSLIRFEGIKLDNDSIKISVHFLENYLGINPGSIFELSKVATIKNRLREIPFLTLLSDPYLTFSGNKAVVNLSIAKNKASRFDAVLGLLPSGNLAGINGLTVTGTLNLDLQNTLGKGERLFVDFQRLKAETQELKMQISYPYIFNYNIGVDASLDIFKADSTFTDIKLNVGLQYLFSGNNYIKLYWTQALTNSGSIDKISILQNYRLPAILDVDATGYGIELQKQKLDYRLNPRKGWSMQLKTDFGNRKIRKNNIITALKNTENPTFNYESLYDSIALKSLRIQSQFNAYIFLPLLQQSTIKIGLQCAGLFTDNRIYQNEQYRIGGNRLIKGFDEASVLATKYAVLNLEYRFLFAQNSFFNVFSDASLVENKTSRINQLEKRIAVGAGMTFETRAGLFSIAYALGKFGANPIDIRNGKIHFGYLNLF
ncbi:MAG: hypothetical protein ACOYOA_04840 [Saprospiraceae bacterium]